MFAESQDIPTSALAFKGLQIGGPGRFELSAHNLDLGTSSGIRSVGPLLNAALPLPGADLAFTLSGDLNMTFSQIASFNGGDVEVSVLGEMNVGSLDQLQFTSNGVPKGIYTAHGGDVSVIGSRIASYDGGDVSVISDTGNVDAGPGEEGFFYVTTAQLNPATGHLETRNDHFFGSGILAFTRADSTTIVGNIFVLAEEDILAGCGGIQQVPFNGPCPFGTSFHLKAGRDIKAAGMLACGNVWLEADGIFEEGLCPLIVSQPVDQIVTAGEDATFAVTTIVSPTLTYQWRKDGVPIMGATASSLTLLGVSRRDAGAYSVAVSNILGGVISQDAVLHVRVPQRFKRSELLPAGTVRLWFGDEDGGFITAEDVTNFTVEASTNLIDWTPLPDLPSFDASGLSYIDDSISEDAPMRFYRVISR